MSAQQGSSSVVALLLTQLFPTESDSVREPLVLAADEAPSLMTGCGLNRITPLLAHAVARGIVVIDDIYVGALMDEMTSVMTSAVAIEAMALEAYSVLDSAGIDVRLTKGIATAHLDYPNPALRQYGDADLLVRPAHFDDALALLGAAAMPQKFPIRGGRWQVQHSVPLESDGLELDLHHRLLHQAAGHLAARTDLFADPEEFTVGGRRVKALPAHLRLIQAAGQNVLSVGADTKISSDVDVLLLEGVTESALQVARDVGLTWLLELGLARARSLVGSPATSISESDSFIDQVMCRIYGGRRASMVGLALAEALVAPPRVTLSSARAVIAPGQPYLELRGRTQVDQIRHQVSRASPYRLARRAKKRLCRQ